MTWLIAILVITLISAIVRVIVDQRRNDELRRGLLELRAYIQTAQVRVAELRALEDWPHQLCPQGGPHLVGCPRDRRGYHGEEDPPPPE